MSFYSLFPERLIKRGRPTEAGEKSGKNNFHCAREIFYERDNKRENKRLDFALKLAIIRTGNPAITTNKTNIHNRHVPDCKQCFVSC